MLKLNQTCSLTNLHCYNPSRMLPASSAGQSNRWQSGHARIDARSLAMHSLIALKLRKDPALLGIAQDNLSRWRSTAGRSTHYFDAWEELLKHPIEEIVNLLQEDSERMRAMRQASPFAGVLTPKERWEIYDAFATGTHNPGRSHNS